MFGFYGRIITIDLSSKAFSIETLPEDIYSRYLGGKGLATHLLLERNPKGIDPLAPENQLIFATGPFCQSRLWGASRYGVYTKSPLTGLYAESYSGGKVPEAIDAAGFDAVIFIGKTIQPAVVSVHPDGAEFHDAGNLWGQDVFNTDQAATEQFASNKDGYRKAGAVVIGPAGEKQVRFALIANDKWRCAGRTGVGAVMGAKHLKAVVFQGDRKRELYSPEGVSEYAKAFSKKYIRSPGVQAYRAMGTTMMVALMNTVGAFPAKYWHQGSCDHWEKISGETYHREHEVKPHACAKCFMACGRMARITKGRHKDLKIEGPEYETILLVDYEDRLNIFDTLILCRFYRDLYTWEELEKAIHLTTSLMASKTVLCEIAANIATMTKTFNLREGFKPEDDRLPQRFHQDPLPSGHVLPGQEMDLMLQDYYRLRLWDTEGIPEEYKK